jgi:hypothetical protein
MNKSAILLGASAVLFGVLTSGAEARKVTYEINGKRYSYSTNNIAQTKQARERIAAAKAAEAAKSKAEAERANNPLTATFGSQAQKEAKEAEDKLLQVLSGKARIEDAALPSVERHADRRTKRQDSRTRMASAVPIAVPPMGIKEPMGSQSLSAMAAPAIAQPLDTQHRARIKSVSFDVETGIKTTIKIDGTVEEEPFDSSVLSHLAPEKGKANSLTAFVNQLRKILPEETTGSIQTSGAEPQPAR